MKINPALLCALAVAILGLAGCELNRVHSISHKPLALPLVSAAVLLFSVDPTEWDDSPVHGQKERDRIWLRLVHIYPNGGVVGGGCSFWDHAEIRLPSGTKGLRYFAFTAPPGLYSSGAYANNQEAPEVLTIRAGRINYVGLYRGAGKNLIRQEIGAEAAKGWASARLGDSFVDATKATRFTGYGPFPHPFMCLP
jgi:hypothetical protein